MGNHIDTDAMRTLAPKFDADVGRHLDTAKTGLNKTNGLEYSNFTSVALPLATVYVEAFDVILAELVHKREAAAHFTDQLNKTADDWDRAEDQSTVKEHG